ncbi:hypothetical protein [Actinophytocola gossypii]|nr:hypothetical protein [Actinophytocola gossypii]
MYASYADGYMAVVYHTTDQDTCAAAKDVAVATASTIEAAG